MLRQFGRTFLRLTHAADPWPVEVVLGVIALAWGLWMLPGWDAFEGSTAYCFLSSLAPDWVWGLAAIGLGLFKIRVATKRRHRGERLATMLGTAWWLTLTVGVALSTTAPPAIPVFGSITLVSAWCYLSLANWRHL